MPKDEIDQIVDRQKALHHKRQDDRELKMRQIRNALNIIFMVAAVVGVIVYLNGNRTTGIYIFIGSMPFKLVELAIRLLKL